MGILPYDEVEQAAALASGQEVQALSALREVLAERLLEADQPATAAISRELRAVLEQLRKLGAGRQESALDEIAARRARRRAAGPAGAEDPPRPTGSGDGGPGGA
jgi:hypothetical protein